METANTWAGQFAVSSDGTLAFSPGASGFAEQRTLTWVDRQGHEEPLPAKPRTYAYPRLSPDGSRIAVDSDDEEHDIWMFDLAKKMLTRLTFGPAFENDPVWSGDGKYLFFSSGPSSVGPGSLADVSRKAADGSGAVEALTRGLKGGYPLSLSPDGKSLLFRKNPGPGLSVLPIEPKGEPHALMADEKFSRFDGEISPDGRWIAYDSNESGRQEIYVRPFPGVDGGRWQISPEGGRFPAWASSGRELFFVSAANKMVAVPVQAGNGFSYGNPQPLFDAGAYYNPVSGRPYDISADGKRFLMVKNAVGNTAARPSIVVVSHWFDELKAKIPAQR